jgi:hypothetical protein
VFIVDAQGLVATDRSVVGRAISVEVPLSPTVKVPARVLSSNASRDVAIVWIDPGVVAGRQPLPMMCPPAASLSMDDGDEIVTIAAPLRAQADMVWGAVTALNPRAIETDSLRLRASCGGADLVPIHPFVLEHRISEKDVIREGLDVFDPAAFGPQCDRAALSLYFGEGPGETDTLTMDAKAIERIWQDFTPYRASAR